MSAAPVMPVEAGHLVERIVPVLQLSQMVDEDNGNIVLIGDPLDGGDVVVVIAVHSRFPSAAFGIPYLLERVDNTSFVFGKSSKKLMISSPSPFPIRPQVTVKWKLRVESSVKSNSRSLIRLSVSSK